MTKKKLGELGLAPLPAIGAGGLIVYGASAPAGGPLSKHEQGIVTEAQTQIQVIRSQRRKAEAAVQEIGQLHRQSAQEFVEIADHLATLTATARGQGYQGMVEEFTQRSAQMAAQHLFGVVEVSSRNIGMETARSLYPDYAPETQENQPSMIQVVPRRSLLQRLLGD